MVGFLAAAPAIGSILGGLGGLFGSKPKAQKQLTPYQAMESQVQGARDHSKEYGFNPLSLLQFGATQGFGAGGSSGSAPPLASIAAITDGLKGLDDAFSGDAERRRQADQLEIDLAKVRLDQAKSGVMPGFQSIAATSGVGNGPSPLGRRAATVAQSSASAAPPAGGRGLTASPIDSLRPIDVAKTPNIGGFYEMENDWTGGPIYLPGESMEGDLDNVAVATVIGAPQIVGRAARRLTYGDTTPLDDLRAAKKREPKHKKDVQEYRENQMRNAPLGQFSTPLPFKR